MSRTQASTGCFQGWLGDGMFLISDRGLSPISLAIRTASAESLHRFFASAQSASLVVIPIWMPRLSVVPEASEPTRGSEVGEQASPASVCLPLRGEHPGVRDQPVRPIIHARDCGGADPGG